MAHELYITLCSSWIYSWSDDGELFLGRHLVRCRDDCLSLLAAGNQQIQHTCDEPDGRDAQGKVCFLCSRTTGDDADDKDGEHQDDVPDQPQNWQSGVPEEIEVSLSPESDNRQATDQGVEYKGTQIGCQRNPGQGYNTTKNADCADHT